MVFAQRYKSYLHTVVQPRKGYLALLFAATLSACQTVPVERSEIADVIPMQWPQTLLQNTAGAQQPHQMPWWEFVEDPLLRQIIGEALNYNRDLQMAVLRVEEAAAILQLRRADQWPTIGVDGQAARSRIPADMSMTQRSAIGGDYGLSVGMSSWELDLWGRIRSLKDAALEEFLAGTYARHAVQASLVAEVARTYLSLQTLDEQIAIAERSIATRQESYRIFKRRHEVGASSFLELTQVETLLMQARVLASQLKQERVDVANALTVLVGKPLDFNAPGAIANTTSSFKSIDVGLPSVVLLQRPDIVAAEHRIRAAEANVTAARAAYFPRISLTTGAGTASAQLSG
ncbi:MAG: efflux transporter outer membrane subunit [Alcaligenaceae bacterium]|nr:efflux transporter outer membrane subunit [Alcaligenaceae bacterium]